MKNLILSMLAMAAMVSCTNENDPIDEVNPTGNNKVEIKLTAGVLKAETRAAVTGNNLEGVQILRKDGKDDTGNWNTPFSVNITDATSNIFTGNAQYYSPNGEEHTYFAGYYPAGTLSSDVASLMQSMLWSRKKP